jgi:hypothetical protein
MNTNQSRRNRRRVLPIDPNYTDPLAELVDEEKIRKARPLEPLKNLALDSIAHQIQNTASSIKKQHLKSRSSLLDRGKVLAIQSSCEKPIESIVLAHATDSIVELYNRDLEPCDEQDSSIVKQALFDLEGVWEEATSDEIVAQSQAVIPVPTKTPAFIQPPRNFLGLTAIMSDPGPSTSQDIPIETQLKELTIPPGVTHSSKGLGLPPQATGIITDKDDDSDSNDDDEMEDVEMTTADPVDRGLKRSDREGGATSPTSGKSPILTSSTKPTSSKRMKGGKTSILGKPPPLFRPEISEVSLVKVITDQGEILGNLTFSVTSLEKSYTTLNEDIKTLKDVVVNQ